MWQHKGIILYIWLFGQSKSEFFKKFKFFGEFSVYLVYALYLKRYWISFWVPETYCSCVVENSFSTLMECFCLGNAKFFGCRKTYLEMTIWRLVSSSLPGLKYVHIPVSHLSPMVHLCFFCVAQSIRQNPGSLGRIQSLNATL